ncbi:MAG: SpoIIE family protein phosphatase, partial [Planctomycetota bacterium]
LVMYTDGINEAPDTSDALFGIPRLRELVAGGGNDVEQVGDHIIDEVKKFTAGTGQADDMCLVMLARG